jgi:ubiquinone/menaquinone biosynthesis C-methylase UbiE
MKRETANRIMESLRRGYDTIASQFAASRSKLEWPELADFRDYLKPGDRVLDLGCGSGRGVTLLAGLAVDYEGLDQSVALIEQAKRDHQDQLVSFRVGSMLDLPYEDRSFEAVLAIASLHHVPSARYRLQALREARRVTKPGGWLLMANWNLWRPGGLRWLARNAVRKLVGRSELDWRDAMIPWRRAGQPTIWRYYHAFTLRELSRLARQAGWQVRRLSVSRRPNRRKNRRPDRRQSNLVTVFQRPPDD